MKYYVDAAAKAGGDGSEKKPFNKIQMAADIALAGDEVIVKPGIYRENVNPKHAGKEGAPIVYRSAKPLAAHITAKDVFDPEILQMIDELGQDLLNNVPYASSVTSLMELSIPVGTEDGFEVTSPFEDGVPSDPEELAEKKAFIMSRESIVNNLVSDDCTETWLIVNLEQYSESLDEAMAKIAPPAMAIFNDPKYKSDKWEIL